MLIYLILVYLIKKLYLQDYPNSLKYIHTQPNISSITIKVRPIYYIKQGKPSKQKKTRWPSHMVDYLLHQRANGLGFQHLAQL